MKRVIMVKDYEDIVKCMNINFDQIYAALEQQRQANKWLRRFVVISAVSIIALLHDSSVLSTRTRMLGKEIEKLKAKLKLNEKEGASKCD